MQIADCQRSMIPHRMTDLSLGNDSRRPFTRKKTQLTKGVARNFDRARISKVAGGVLKLCVDQRASAGIAVTDGNVTSNQTERQQRTGCSHSQCLAFGL